SLLMRSVEPLAEYDHRIGAWLDRWAREAPDRLFLVEQASDGERTISYRESHERALALAERLLTYGLGPDHPLAILAPNCIDHALVMLAALYVGIPVAPIAPAYALRSTDLAKLAHSFRLLTPGMVVAGDGALYGKAIDETLESGVPVVAMRNISSPSKMISLSSLFGDGSG